ncbi:MAG TPA: TonB-dependent receptor, partial [Bryobacteraceae bacterium]
MSKKASLVLALLAILVALFPCAFAQTVVSGEISGTLSDQTGAVVPGGSVTLKALATGETKTMTTGKAGDFHFSLLRPGTYSVVATAKGFSQSEKQVAVQLGQVMDLKIQLGVQSQTQVVEVSEAVSLLQNENANLATSFDRLQLENLPAGGMDMTAYAQTAPGVTLSTGGGYGNFSAFGLPGVSNLFTINGADNMDPYLNLNNSGASNLTLGANEISEAAVVLNGYTGQYGRQAGAQVNYVTKSGANAFHGNATWLYNERVMNANDWFNNATSTDRPFAISRGWAASIGGPIKRNKAFFFVDNEGLRYVLSPGGTPVYIPTAAFSSYVLNNLKANNAAAVPIYTNAFNLYAGSSGAGHAVPLTKGDDPALGCGDFAAAGFGTTQPCAATFQNTVNNLNTEWLMAAKVDYNINTNHRIFFRFNTDHGVQATSTDAINNAFSANSVQPSYGGQFGYNASFGPRTVNQLVVSASYYTAIFGPPDFAKAIATFPTTWAFADGVLTNMGGGGAGGAGDSTYPQGRKVRQNQLLDDYAIIAGTQTIKFGVNARRNWVSTYATLPNTSGFVTFASMTDFVNGVLTPAAGDSYSQAFPQVGAEPLSMYSMGFYGQDEWKIRPNLTWTVAWRFDRNSNIHCASNCFNELLSPFNVLLHDPNIPYNQAIHSGLGNAFPSIEPIVSEPRTGFAWSPTQSTVIRGGVGIFSDLYQALIADRFITNSPGVATFSTQSGVVAPGAPNSVFAAVANSNAAFKSGFASGATLSQLQKLVPLGFSTPTFNTIGNNFNDPKYYEWNLEVQQGLGSKATLSVNYVGNKGSDETLQNLYTNAFSKTGFAGLPTTAPDPRFGQIRELYDSGYSNYNGLVTSLKWRAGSQFSGQISYIWSHALDTCSNACLEPFNALTDVSIRYQISPFIGLNYGSSDYDVR